MATPSPISNPTAKVYLQLSDNPVVEFFLGGLFDKVKDTMNDIIDHAEAAAIQVEMQAGKEIASAIENAKNAYQAELLLTVDKVSEACKERLNQLDTMVQVFEKQAVDEVQDLMKQVQQFINTLPFTKTQPQLTSVDHNFAVEGDTNLSITFTGNFPSSADPAYPPTLTFDNTELELVNSGTQSLTFGGSFDQIFPPTDGESTSVYSWKVGKLNVPFDNTSNLPWYDKLPWKTYVANYTYNVLQTALPLSPGKITAVYTQQINIPENKHFVSGQIVADGTKEHVAITIGKIPAEPSYQIVVGSQTLVIDAETGETKSRNATISEATVSEVGYSAAALWGSSIRFHIEFDETKNTPATKPNEVTVNIKFGESAALAVESPEQGRLTNITFDSFDGKHNEFGTGTDLSNRYIQILNQGDNVIVKATPPSSISELRNAIKA